MFKNLFVKIRTSDTDTDSNKLEQDKLYQAVCRIPQLKSFFTSEECYRGLIGRQTVDVIETLGLAIDYFSVDYVIICLGSFFLFCFRILI